MKKFNLKSISVLKLMKFERNISLLNALNQFFAKISVKSIEKRFLFPQKHSIIYSNDEKFNIYFVRFLYEKVVPMENLTQISIIPSVSAFDSQLHLHRDGQRVGTDWSDANKLIDVIAKAN